MARQRLAVPFHRATAAGACCGSAQRRLKSASRHQAVEPGERDGDLSEAWKVVRLALERLYLVGQIKYGPADFKPASWAEQTLESMYNAGFSAVLAARAPAGSAERLKRVQELSHAAHARSKCDRGRAPITVARASPPSKRITVGRDSTP